MSDAPIVASVELEREEMAEDFSAMLEQLTAQGVINGGDVNKLHDAGIYSCNGLMLHTKENLTEINGLSKAKVDIIWEAAEKTVEAAAIEAERVLKNRRKTINTIGRKDLMENLLGKRKRIEVLEASISLNYIRDGDQWVKDPKRQRQISHWERELVSCQRKVKNLEMHILQRKPL